MRTAWLAIAALLLKAPLFSGADDWPQFRGAQANGVAEGHALPEAFDIATGEGVRWRAKVEGLGLSSPVIWASAFT